MGDSARKIAIFSSYRKQVDEFIGYGFFHCFGHSGNVEDGIGMVAVIERDNGDVETRDADCIRFYIPKPYCDSPGEEKRAQPEREPHGN